MSTFRRRLMNQSKKSDLPEGCTRLAYLISTGKQWIDTEHICQADEDIYIDFLPFAHRGVDSTYIMGWRWNGDNSQSYHCGIYRDKTAPVYLYLGTSYHGVKISEGDSRLRVFISPNKQEITVNETKIDISADWAAPYGGSYTNYLCSFNNKGTNMNLPIALLYEYWVKNKDGHFIQHFIPILDANGIACMYDVVNGKFYYSKSDESFIAPLNEPYLINYGRAYIDTLLKPTSNTSVKIKYHLMSGVYPASFGTGTSITSRFEIIHDISEIRRVLSRWGASYTDYSDIYKIYEVDMLPDRFVVNGEIVYEGSGNNVSGGNIFLFGTSRQLGNSNFIGYIYYCKIYEGDVLVRDFVPHYQDGKWGMLDKVENKFYTSPNRELFDGYIPNE
jgi:hypothetical protein